MPIQTGMNRNNAQSVQELYASKQTAVKNSGVEKTSYGKTIGEPQLSEEGQKYYEELKKKYSNFDFILVSEDQKENAQANAARYANPVKTVVLIGEDKVEKMATDENFRKQYEGILSGAEVQLSQLKESVEKTGAQVSGYGMQVDDKGTATYFAVLKKSSEAQKERIEKKNEEKLEAKKEAEKEEAKKAQKERIKGKEEQEDTVTISANSVDELLRKITEYDQNERVNQIQTDSEKMIGQHFDIWG